MPLLEMRNICKAFSGVYANENINLKVNKGEIHARRERHGAAALLPGAEHDGG